MTKQPPPPPTTILPVPPVDPMIAADMPTTNRPMNAGSSMNDNASRLDGVAKVTGTAKYGRDVYPQNGMFVSLVRCPYGAADLESCNLDAARAVPGVIEVEVGGKEGKFHGHRVGYIVAESPLAIKRGLRALQCVWKRKPVKTRITDAIEMPDAGGPVKDAELHLDVTYSTPVQPHSCLETHGGSIDYQQDKAVVYASTQGTSAGKDGLDKPLGLPQSAIECVCEYVGGGFGSKLGGPGNALQAGAAAAGKHKRSAWAFVNRSEDQTDTGNRPSSRTSVHIGFKKDGSIVGGDVRTWGGTGVGGGGGCHIPSGRYDLSGVEKEHKDVKLNNGSPMPARAPAFPQGAFAEELMLDEIAEACKLDPLRLKHRLVSSDVYREMFDLGEKMIGWKDRKPTGSQTSALRIGYGVGTCSWHSAGPGGNAEVVINRDGSVEARTGTQDPGTGTRTIAGIAAADALGVPLRVVRVMIGHTGLPKGPASGGSQVTPQIAPTMAVAARDAKKQLLELIATRDKADVGELDIQGGVITRNKQPFLEWTQACERISNDGIKGSNKEKGEAGKGGNQGVQFIKLSVDAETGIVHPLHVVAIQACGRVIFRKGAESQVIGAVTQGLSNALYEEQVLDRNIGTMLNDNLESYKLIGPNDMPHIEPVLWTKGNPTGVRGIGEPAIVGTSGAVACAIYNAIGKPVRHLPMTPDKILAAMEGANA